MRGELSGGRGLDLVQERAEGGGAEWKRVGGAGGASHRKGVCKS